MPKSRQIPEARRDELSRILDNDQVGGIGPTAKQLMDRKGREWTRQFMLALKELLDTTEEKLAPSSSGPLLPKMPLPPHIAKKRREEH